jgi:MFS family permease
VLASYAIFVVTQYAMWIGILVYAYGQGGVTAAGLVSLAQLIPAALAAPFFATVADRRSPIVLLTGGYVLQALGCAVVAAAIFVDTSPYAVYAGAVLASTAVTTTRPAQAALVPGLARDLPELTATNVLIGWVESISIVLAGTGGGLLMAWNGVAPVAAASVALLAAAVLLVAVLPAVPMREGDSASAFRQVADGIAAVRSNKPAGVLVSVLAMEFMFIGALDVLLVVLAIDVLGHGEGWAGYLNSAYGAGGVVVGGFASLIIGRKLGPVVVATGLLLGLAFAATTLVSAEVPVMLLLAVVGASRALFDVASRSLLQRAVSADMVARIFGLTEGLSMAGLAAGSLLVPVLTAVGGGRLALLSVAAILPLVVMLRLRLLLKLDEQAQVPLVEMSLLRSTPVFGGLPAPALEGVARALQRVDVFPGSAIISQGDEATQHYYVVADGVVQIQQDGRPIRELGRGSGLGEIALLHGGPRTASALALTPVTLYSLDRESFLISLQGHAASWSAARVVADEYLAHDSDRSERPPPDPERG